MNKQTEALKMDLENLIDRFNEGWHEGIEIDASDIMLLTNLREALEQPSNMVTVPLDKLQDMQRRLRELHIGIDAFPEQPAQYQHKWDAEGETCVKCGDKDWMGGSCSVADEQPSPAWQSLIDCEINELDDILETIRDLDTDSAEKMLMEFKSKRVCINKLKD